MKPSTVLIYISFFFVETYGQSPPRAGQAVQPSQAPEVSPIQPEDWEVSCDEFNDDGSPSGFSLQRLCARSTGLRRLTTSVTTNLDISPRSLKGYLYAPAGQTGPEIILPPVCFERGATRIDVTLDLRQALLCTNRCWGRNWLNRHSGATHWVKPVGYPLESKIEKLDAETSVYVLNLDEDTSQSVLLTAKSGARFTRVLSGLQADSQLARTPSAIEVALDPSHMIKCNEPLPNPFLNEINTITTGLGIPPPYTFFRFETIRKLCAVSLAGGNPGANAGAYCSANPSWAAGEEGQTRDISFSDELTPRREWTWAQNREFSTRVRSLCFQRCWCASDDKNKKKIQEKHRAILEEGWKISKNAIIKKPVGGQGSTTIEMTGKSKKKIFPGLFKSKSEQTKQCSTDYRTGEQTCLTNDPCLVDGENICALTPWSVEDFGPIPQATADKITNVAPMCGLACSGPAAQQCSVRSGEAADDCKCVYLTPSLRARLRRLGTNVASFSGGAGTQIAALCLSVSYFKRASELSRLQGIGGRSLGSDLLDRNGVVVPEQWSCMCNATYASAGCCDTSSGLVWEPTGLRL